MPQGKKDQSPITGSDVSHVVALAHLVIDPAKLPIVQKELQDSLAYVRQVQQLDLSAVPETVQISGLENITREDRVDTARMLSQPEALANAPRQHQGFFMVPAIMEV